MQDAAPLPVRKSGRPCVVIIGGGFGGLSAARVLRKGGRLLAMTLGRHAHRTTVEPFDHRNLGFKPEELREYARAAKLDVVACERLTRERRPPHFEVLSLLARKP